MMTGTCIDMTVLLTIRIGEFNCIHAHVYNNQMRYKSYLEDTMYNKITLDKYLHSLKLNSHDRRKTKCQVHVSYCKKRDHS